MDGIFYARLIARRNSAGSQRALCKRAISSLAGGFISRAGKTGPIDLEIPLPLGANDVNKLDQRETLTPERLNDLR